MNKPLLKDSFGRAITYLRLSITDRCNLRCFYCMPQARFNWMPPEYILRFEEIIQIVRVLAKIGIKKVRLTGGEPLVRKDALNLIKRISGLEGIKKVCLTTNGTLLPEMARELFETGLRHINVSLDTLNPERFEAITGRDSFKRVWLGIENCLELGFDPVKINFVMMKGKNDDEITEFAKLTKEYPLEVRFIEFMPVGEMSKWKRDLFISSDEAKALIEKEVESLNPLKRKVGAGPADLYSFSNSPGKIGFISPLSHKFCSTCNRIRIRADGRLRLCLFSDREIDLMALVRQGTSDQELTEFLAGAIYKKPARYLENSLHIPSCKRQMSTIGG